MLLVTSWEQQGLASRWGRAAEQQGARAASRGLWSGTAAEPCRGSSRQKPGDPRCEIPPPGQKTGVSEHLRGPASPGGASHLPETQPKQRNWGALERPQGPQDTCWGPPCSCKGGHVQHDPRLHPRAPPRGWELGVPRPHLVTSTPSLKTKSSSRDREEAELKRLPEDTGGRGRGDHGACAPPRRWAHPQQPLGSPRTIPWLWPAGGTLSPSVRGSGSYKPAVVTTTPVTVRRWDQGDGHRQMRPILSKWK